MMPVHVLRLKSPRPTFPGDMTAVEAAAMGEHGAYWQGLAGRGVAIVVGPVLDPRGPWGLAVVETASFDEAQALGEADPVIRAGLGFAYDIHPMAQAILRQAT
jgi:uncharacterized protein YciI